MRSAEDAHSRWQQLAATARVSSRALGLGAWTAGMVGAAGLRQRMLPPEAREAEFQRFMKVWAKGLLEMFGVTAAIEPPVVPPAVRPRLVVSNHRSPVDIGVLLHHFGGICLSRADLQHWPILGTAARAAGTIFVDREDRRSGVQAIRQIRRCLMQGRTVIVFPEGGTYDGDQVRPFHPGSFAALRGLDVELLPVGVAYPPGTEFVGESFTAHLRRTAERPRTLVSAKVGSPRTAAGTAARMAEIMQHEVQRLVHEARRMRAT